MINDLPKVIYNFTVADDAGFYIRDATLAQLNETINKDLKSLDDWLNDYLHVI